MPTLDERAPKMNVETREDAHAVVDAIAKARRPPVTAVIVRGKENGPAALLARGLEPGLVRKPHIDTMLGSAYVALHAELARLSEKATIEGLTATEAMQLQKYVDSLTKLAKEEREQVRQDKLDQLTDEELEKAYAELKDVT